MYNLVQWISTALVAVNENETCALCDMLCTSTFSVLGLLLPSVPPCHHLICLQFICRVLFHASSKAVSTCAVVCDASHNNLFRIENLGGFIPTEDW